jgi:hypothetical protein
MSPQLSLHERNIFGLGVGVDAQAVIKARHLCDVGIELLYSPYKLTYIDALGLLKYICDVVLLLLSCTDGKHGEKVEQHKIIKRLAGHSPWA